MTKKGAILSVILLILVVTLAFLFIKQDNKPKTVSRDNQVVKQEKEDDIFVASEEEFNLEELKSQRLPIIIQLVSDNDEQCKTMQDDLQKLAKEMKDKVIIKIIDINKYPNLINEIDISTMRVPTQILITSRGLPYKNAESVASGYKVINDGSGKVIYTLHDGELTLAEMRTIVQEMS